MTVREFYEKIGSDYEEVISRLATEERILKYLKRFTEECAFSDFEKAYEEKNYEAVFRATHSIKGMCLNLGFTELQQSSSELCEMFRYGKPGEDVTDMVTSMRSDYRVVIDAIKAL